MEWHWDVAYSLTSLSALASRIAFAKVRKTSIEKMFASGLRSDALLLGLATRTARSPTTRQEDSEWVDELRRECASLSIESAWIYIFWTKKGEMLPKFLVRPLVVIGPRNEFPVNFKDVSVSVSSAFLCHFTSDDSRRNLRQALRGHLLKTVSTVVEQRLSFFPHCRATGARADRISAICGLSLLHRIPGMHDLCFTRQ